MQRNAESELLQLQERLEHKLDQIGSIRDSPDHAVLVQKVDSVLDQLQKTEKDVRHKTMALKVETETTDAIY